jgi:hypothetical protein
MNFPKTPNLFAIIFAKGVSLFATGRMSTPCPPKHGQTTDALELNDGGRGVPTTLRRQKGLRAMTYCAALSMMGCVLLSGQAHAQRTVLSVSPVSPFAFGSKVVGSTTSQVFTVTLVGPISARIIAITPAVAASRMTITGGTCAAGVTLGSPCTLAVSFNPIAAQAYSGFIKIDSTSNGIPATPVNIDLSGIGTAAALPAITVTPAALNFGSIVAGTQSSLQSYTVRNSGTVNATVSAITATLSSPGVFIDVNEACTGTTLAPAQTCLVPVRFTPATAGSYSGTLRFYLSGSAAQAAQATLSGTATAPPLTPPILAPQPVVFPGTATIGTPVPPRVLTLSNPNPQPITTGISIAGAGFTQATTCSPTLAANASCTITVTFTPTVVGATNGSVTATTSAGTVSSALSGTAIAQPPPLLPPTLSPSAINFGSIIVGLPSRPQTATLTNPNNVAVAVSAITSTPGFAQTNTCGASLAAGASCVISITFTATTVGNATGSLNAATPQGNATSSLTGAGAPVPLVPPQATPEVITFAAITVGTTSAAQTITVKNPNTQSITLGGFNANSTFVVSLGTCGPTLAAGQSCTYTVVFKPNTVGATTAALTLSSNAGTDTVSVSGSGTAPMQPPTLSPSAINFGAIVVGQPSRPQALTLTNLNSSAMPVTAVSSSAGFAQTNTCGASLAGGASCVITITFTPSAVSNATGTVNVTTPQGNVSASLAGAGAQVALVPPQVTPATISFAATTVSTTSAAQIITVSNPNTQAITLSGFNTNSTFAVAAGTCGATLAAAQSCTYTVVFNPTLIGNTSGTLAVTSNAGTATVTATGVGLAVVPPPVVAPLTPLALSLSNWDFGTVTLGAQSSTRPFTLQNTNAVAVSPLQISTTSGFSQSNTCGLTLAAGASCQINVQYTATNLGAVTGALNVTVAGAADTAALSATATLKGLGVAAAVVVPVVPSAQPGSVISATPRFMQASISAATSQFITYSFTPGNPRVTVADGIFCTTLTSPAPTTGATATYACAANSEFARHPTTATTFQTVQQNGSVVRATETIRIPSSVTRTAQSLGAATFYFVRRFDPQGFAVVEIRATGAIMNAPIALNDVRLAFDTSQGPQPLVFVARGAALPPVTATLFYTGSGVLRGRWELVLPGDVAPTERDLLPEASLPRSERGTQRRYQLLQRFEQLLPGNGRVELKLPSLSPTLGATAFDGQYQLLLRIEAEPSIYGGESGAANFAMPLLRYFVGSITAPAARITPVTAQIAFNGARPTFSWSAVPQARYYRIEVADRNSTVIYSAIVRDNERSYSALSGFTAAAGNQWRVQALDKAVQPVGESPWRATNAQ